MPDPLHACSRGQCWEEDDAVATTNDARTAHLMVEGRRQELLSELGKVRAALGRGAQATWESAKESLRVSQGRRGNYTRVAPVAFPEPPENTGISEREIELAELELEARIDARLASQAAPALPKPKRRRKEIEVWSP